jgi:signal transduction histidine kinase
MVCEFSFTSGRGKISRGHVTPMNPTSNTPPSQPARSSPAPAPSSKKPFSTWLWAFPIVWTLLVGLAVLWNVSQTVQSVRDLARVAARASFEKDILYRQWASAHGGVYVPVTARTPPNPYLTNVVERDLTTPSGRLLTLVNPAYMNRQVYELDKKTYQHSGHITSLKPMRPANAPDAWERQALAAFERGVREAQKLEAIGQLAGGVAHDFNNMLAAMMMSLDLLRDHANLDEDLRGILQEMSASAQRSAKLTRQLLMFSRRSVLEISVLDVNDVVANLLRMLGRLIGEHIELQFHRRKALPAVEADAGMLEQILMNLCVNARDAMPKGGRITITTEAVEVDELRANSNPDARPGQFVCLAVADTGCGMDSATLKRIFEPFFTTKEVGKGTGLGLATVYGIVAQHKGWVEVESQLGQGTTFRVFLPTSTKSLDKTSQGSQPRILATGHETILLVEDDPNVRQMVAHTLKGLGYHVFTAAKGQQAMEVWQTRSQEVDLLFTDMVLPEGTTGLELAEKLRAEKPALKVIISSGYSSEVVQLAKATRTGIVYLPKPYEVSLLSTTVRDCLDRK